jgi:hypothetical protein
LKSKMISILTVFNHSKQSLFFALVLLMTFGASNALAKNFSNVSLNNQNIRPVELAQSAHISGSVAKGTTPHISGSVDLFRRDEKKEPLFGASEENNAAPENQTVSTAKKESSLAEADRRKAPHQTASAKNKLQSSQDRTTQRKTCWAQCETEFRSSIQEQCTEKSVSSRKNCRAKFFEKRMMCVRKTCQGM